MGSCSRWSSLQFFAISVIARKKWFIDLLFSCLPLHIVNLSKVTIHCLIYVFFIRSHRIYFSMCSIFTFRSCLGSFLRPSFPILNVTNELILWSAIFHSFLSPIISNSIVRQQLFSSLISVIYFFFAFTFECRSWIWIWLFVYWFGSATPLCFLSVKPCHKLNQIHYTRISFYLIMTITIIEGIEDQKLQ